MTMFLTALKKFFLQLLNGQQGLARTYWLFGMGGIFVITEVLSPVLDAAFSYYATFIIIPLLAIYQCCIAISIFRAADRFQGNSVWPFLAKATTGLAMLKLLLSLMELATAQG